MNRNGYAERGPDGIRRRSGREKRTIVGCKQTKQYESSKVRLVAEASQLCASIKSLSVRQSTARPSRVNEYCRPSCRYIQIFRFLSISLFIHGECSRWIGGGRVLSVGEDRIECEHGKCLNKVCRYARTDGMGARIIRLPKRQPKPSKHLRRLPSLLPAKDGAMLHPARRQGCRSEGTETCRSDACR